jgi:hypothetical protein
MLGRLAKGEQTVGDLAAPHRISQRGTSGVTCLVERAIAARDVLRDLCTYRDVLCLPNKKQ